MESDFITHCLASGGFFKNCVTSLHSLGTFYPAPLKGQDCADTARVCYQPSPLGPRLQWLWMPAWRNLSSGSLIKQNMAVALLFKREFPSGFLGLQLGTFMSGVSTQGTLPTVTVRGTFPLP